MGVIRIEYKKKGFWVPEAFIEILSHYVATEYEKKKITDYSDALQGVYDDFDSNRSGSARGMVGIFFDEYLKNEVDEEDTISILEATKATLTTKGEKIEIEELNAIENRKIHDSFKSPWTTSIYVSSLVSVLDIMIKMLKGEWASSNESVWFKGFGAPDGVEQV